MIGTGLLLMAAGLTAVLPPPQAANPFGAGQLQLCGGCLVSEPNTLESMMQAADLVLIGQLGDISEYTTPDAGTNTLTELRVTEVIKAPPGFRAERIEFVNYNTPEVDKGATAPLVLAFVRWSNDELVFVDATDGRFSHQVPLNELRATVEQLKKLHEICQISGDLPRRVRLVDWCTHAVSCQALRHDALSTLAEMMQELSGSVTGNLLTGPQVRRLTRTPIEGLNPGALSSLMFYCALPEPECKEFWIRALHSPQFEDASSYLSATRFWDRLAWDPNMDEATRLMAKFESSRDDTYRTNLFWMVDTYRKRKETALKELRELYPLPE